MTLEAEKRFVFGSFGVSANRIYRESGDLLRISTYPHKHQHVDPTRIIKIYEMDSAPALASKKHQWSFAAPQNKYFHSVMRAYHYHYLVEDKLLLPQSVAIHTTPKC
jgi:hypothetical protein